MSDDLTRPELKATPFHFNRPVRRQAEFIKPPNILKAKVGSGGLDEEILEKAQALLENNATEFHPLAEIYLSALMKGIEYAHAEGQEMDGESVIAGMLYPAMQLKANGGMFRYALVTTMADKLAQFLEVIDEPDFDAVEIVLAFHTTIRAVVMGRIDGDGGRHGQDLLDALDEACVRYLDKTPPDKKRENEHYDFEQ